MNQIIECVPNFSEGRNQDVIREISEAISNTKGVHLLNVDPGQATNRTVMTFVGDPDSVINAAFNAIKVASEKIDMSKHSGEHPRFGATDVCPLIPVSNISFDEIIPYAEKLAKLVSEIIEFGTINSDKDIENFDFKSYLLDKGLSGEVTSIYKSNLLKTYRSVIKSDFEVVENSFLGLLDLHNQLLEKKDLIKAFNDLEQNMNQESYENFLRIKKESLAKN